VCGGVWKRERERGRRRERGGEGEREGEGKETARVCVRARETE